MIVIRERREEENQRGWLSSILTQNMDSNCIATVAVEVMSYLPFGRPARGTLFFPICPRIYELWSFDFWGRPSWISSSMDFAAAMVDYARCLAYSDEESGRCNGSHALRFQLKKGKADMRLCDGVCAQKWSAVRSFLLDKQRILEVFYRLIWSVWSRNTLR